MNPDHLDLSILRDLGLKVIYMYISYIFIFINFILMNKYDFFLHTLSYFNFSILYAEVVYIYTHIHTVKLIEAGKKLLKHTVYCTTFPM